MKCMFVSVNFATFVFGDSRLMPMWAHVCKLRAQQAQDKLVDSELDKMRNKNAISACEDGLNCGTATVNSDVQNSKPTKQSSTTLCHVPCTSVGIYKS